MLMLRAASAHRIIHVEIDDPATSAIGGHAAAWPPSLPHAEVLVSTARRYEARVPRDFTPADALGALDPALVVRSFSLEPPPLSDVFLEVLS